MTKIPDPLMCSVHGCHQVATTTIVTGLETRHLLGPGEAPGPNLPDRLVVGIPVCKDHDGLLTSPHLEKAGPWA